MSFRRSKLGLLMMAALLMLFSGLIHASQEGHSVFINVENLINYNLNTDVPCDESSTQNNTQDHCNADTICTPPAMVTQNLMEFYLQSAPEQTPWSADLTFVYLDPEPRPPCLS